MANPEHLEILMQGVEVWNEWRKANPEITPDLSEACLFGVNLYGGSDITNLTKVNLSGAEMKGANLIRVDLETFKLMMRFMLTRGWVHAVVGWRPLSSTIFGQLSPQNDLRPL